MKSVFISATGFKSASMVSISPIVVLRMIAAVTGVAVKELPAEAQARAYKLGTVEVDAETGEAKVTGAKQVDKVRVKGTFARLWYVSLSPGVVNGMIKAVTGADLPFSTLVDLEDQNGLRILASGDVALEKVAHEERTAALNSWREAHPGEAAAADAKFKAIQSARKAADDAAALALKGC